jgi:hypothetical protein
MIPEGTPIERILRSLQERAKELDCLYRVDELFKHTETPLPEIFTGLLQAIPPGYQYPHLCQVRVTYDGQAYQSPAFRETAWVQSAPIAIDGEPVGKIDVFYTEMRSKADEGPFLKEERRLINTIADRLGHFLEHRKLQDAFESLETARQLAPTAKGQWRVIIDFLRRTDQTLLFRITRKMLNHLCWVGIQEAVDLLHRVVYEPDTVPDLEFGEDNRPSDSFRSVRLIDVTDEAFSIAAAHLSEDDILASVQLWIRQDRARFFSNAVNSPDSSLDEVTEAIRRLHHIPADEVEFPPAVEKGLRVSLISHFFTDHLSFINIAKRYLDVDDYFEIVEHMVFPAKSRGKLGGKAAGLILALKILEKVKERPPELGTIKTPRTWYVTTDGVIDFIQYNNLEDVYNQKYADLDQVRNEYPHLVQIFKNSSFSPEVVKGLSVILDDLEGRPLIVRSSSLLEDRFDAAFSGKYKSLFLANTGTKQERLAALMDAIAEVYASVFGPDPIEYRMERGLLDVYEEMGILVQEVVGTRIGRYFLPSFSGVAFSRNEFRWSARIKREDGLLRLVPGLGTRAVDRLKDDYPVLMAPGQPNLRVNVTLDEIIKYSPKKLDVINLETGGFETVAVRDFLKEVNAQVPQLGNMVSILEEDRVRRPIGREIESNAGRLVVTFEGLAASTPFVRQIRTILEILEREIGTPVDIEFASDGRDLYLLQCRPQSSGRMAKAAPIPHDIPIERHVFTARRFVSNGSAHNLTHVVYVDPDRYNDLGTMEELRAVGRAVGKLNKILPKRQFLLIGPGRWGSRGDIKLGVNVTYSDINNTAVLIEVARKKGNYLPDLSFGTHFFQDLVEAEIRYLPLYPDDPGIVFKESFFRDSPNILPQLLPEFAELAATVRVIDIGEATDGMVMHVLMNADLEQAVAFLAPREETAEEAAMIAAERERARTDHWRWRLLFAERLAAQLDPERFGVKALYVFGSVKNATAGPASDIDLLVHFQGTPAQRADLLTWFEGWSLCLSELNFLRTGSRAGGLLDVHMVTDEDIVKRTPFAAKIGAVTDQARLLTLGRPGGPRGILQTGTAEAAAATAAARPRRSRKSAPVRAGGESPPPAS